MKTIPFRLVYVIAFAAALGLLLVTAPPASASAENHIDEGLAVSQSWVGMIDSGDYDNSYNIASGEMHDKVKQDRWDIILKALRSPWGPLVNRQQLSHIYKPNGYEGTEGEFLIVTYQTAFKKMDVVSEIVVLRWEDGKWRGAGYNAAPQGTAVTDDPNQGSPTEVQTQQHVKAVPQ